MTKWWIAFAVAVPLSYAFGVELAKSDVCTMKSSRVGYGGETKRDAIINSIRIKELKTFSCQLMYKVLAQDLKEKYRQHEKGLYRMPANVKKYYEDRIDEFTKACLPQDGDLPEAPQEVKVRLD